VDRSASPRYDATRRASHGDRRRALQEELLDSEFRRCGICGHGSRKIRELFQAVVNVVAKTPTYGKVQHESQGTEVLFELSAIGGAAGCSRGHRRKTPGATRGGAEEFRDIFQAPVFGHRKAAQASAPRWSGPTQDRWPTRTP